MRVAKDIAKIVDEVSASNGDLKFTFGMGGKHPVLRIEKDGVLLKKMTIPGSCGDIYRGYKNFNRDLNSAIREIRAKLANEAVAENPAEVARNRAKGKGKRR